MYVFTAFTINYYVFIYIYHYYLVIMLSAAERSNTFENVRYINVINLKFEFDMYAAILQRYESTSQRFSMHHISNWLIYDLLFPIHGACICSLLEAASWTVITENVRCIA